MKKLYRSTGLLALGCAMWPLLPASAQNSSTSVAPISVSITPRAFKENAGANVVVALRQASTSPVTVSLTTNAPQEITFPAEVTIPAGQTSVSFPIRGVEDARYEGTQRVLVAFVSPLGTVRQELLLIDSTPRIGLQITPRTVREDSGRSVRAYVTLSQAVAQPITVQLTSSEPNRVRVPASATVPAGARYVSFPLEVIDNNVVENDRVVAITLNTGVAGVAPVVTRLSILDDDKQKQPKWVFKIEPRSFSETAGTRAATAVIKVNQALEGDVVFRLTSSSPKVQVPVEVTLPEGMKLVSFPIGVTDNTTQDGRIQANIVAVSSQITLRETVVVRDDESDDDDDDNSGTSTVRVSSASALAANNTIRLGFTGPLNATDAADDSNFQVRVGSLELDVEDVSYSTTDNTITILLKDEIPLRAGERVIVGFRDLRDANGLVLDGRSVPLTVR
jgi:hypothetical protein